MEKLQPCPFCGGRAELCGTDETKIFYVECLDCDFNGNFDTPEEAIAAWNRRQAMEVTVKIWHEANTTAIPEYATVGSSGVDLSSAKYCIIQPNELTLIPTGIKLAIPEGYEGQVRPRSGLALNHRIIIPNAPGTIDSDYRGEVKVMLLNMGEEPFTIRLGDRIAQLVFVPVARAKFEAVKELDQTERGSGGFGSTGRR